MSRRPAPFIEKADGALPSLHALHLGLHTHTHTHTAPIGVPPTQNEIILGTVTIYQLNRMAFEALDDEAKNKVRNNVAGIVSWLGFLPIYMRERASGVANPLTYSAGQIIQIKMAMNVLYEDCRDLFVSMLEAYPSLYVFSRPAAQKDHEIIRRVLLADGNAMEYITPGHVFEPIARLIASNSSTMRFYDRAMQDGPVILEVMKDAARLSGNPDAPNPNLQSVDMALQALQASDSALHARIEPYFATIMEWASSRDRKNRADDNPNPLPDMELQDFWWSAYTDIMIINRYEGFAQNHSYFDETRSCIVMPASQAVYRTTIDSISALRSNRKLVYNMVELYGQTLSYCELEFQRDPKLRLVAAETHEPTALLVIRDLAYDAATDTNYLRRSIRRIGENNHWSEKLIVGQTAEQLMAKERPALLEWVEMAVVQIMLQYPSTTPGLSAEQVRLRQQLTAEAERIVAVIENPEGRVFSELRKRRYEEDMGPEGEEGFRQTRRRQIDNARRAYLYERAESMDEEDEDAAFEKALFTHVHWVHTDDADA